MSNISGSMSDLERRLIETGGSPSLTRAESLAEGSLSGGVRTVVGKIEAFQFGDTPSSANRGAFAAVKVDGSVAFLKGSISNFSLIFQPNEQTL